MNDSQKIKSIIAVDKTADSLLNVLKIDKTKAVDSFLIGKKVGLYNSKNSFEKANSSRYEIAIAIAKYIIDVAKTTGNHSNQATSFIEENLALSILLPKKEVSDLYSSIVAKGVSKFAAYSIIARKYGVSSSIVQKRISLIMLEEAKINV